MIANLLYCLFYIHSHTSAGVSPGALPFYFHLPQRLFNYMSIYLWCFSLSWCSFNENPPFIFFIRQPLETFFLPFVISLYPLTTPPTPFFYLFRVRSFVLCSAFSPAEGSSLPGFPFPRRFLFLSCLCLCRCVSAFSMEVFVLLCHFFLMPQPFSLYLSYHSSFPVRPYVVVSIIHFIKSPLISRHYVRLMC